MRKSPLLAVILIFSPFSLPTHAAAVLQWVKTVGGSGGDTVVKAAADAQGDLLIVGNTSSLDFPITAAAQRAAGGSTLVRVNTTSGATDKLYPPGLSAATSIAADPGNPQTLYATQANAIWRSADAGATWSILFQFPSDVTARSIAVDPANTKNLYVGTNPPGPFKSIDGGLTWTLINNGFTSSRDGRTGVYRIWVDRKSPQVIFASATSGLYRSPDAGATWTAVVTTFYSDNTLVFDPFAPSTIYLASGSAITRSTDDGLTFRPLSQLPENNPAAALVADPLHTGVLFAGSYSSTFRSVDSGVTWTRRGTASATLLAADPNNAALYASSSTPGIIKSTDGFSTSSPIGPPVSSPLQMLVAGANVFLVTSPSTDVFAVKLDPDGNIVYSTYFGGTGNDSAADMALGPDGSVYVTGTTASADFPVTAGAYASKMSGLSSNFVFKLKPDGSLDWATYFAGFDSVVQTIAVDSAGNPYVGGHSTGGLPTTPGAYQTDFRYMAICTGIAGCFPGNTSSFVTKFNAQGTGLVYSTYVSTDIKKNVVQTARGMAIDASGNAYLGGNENVVLLNASGTALLASSGLPGISINAVALDAGSNLYVTGISTTGVFPATSGAFQRGPQPATPSLPSQGQAGGLSDAFVVKWDKNLSQPLAATLLGGESTDIGESIAIDSTGNVLVSGLTDSQAFPIRSPFQTSFSPRAGFVASLDSTLSQLLFSTYVGDTRAFDARTAVPDGNGNILLAGSTLVNPGNLFIGGDPGASFTAGGLVVANKITVAPSSGPRLDSVVNFASHLAGPIAPGEAIAAVGAGFGPDAQLIVDGVPLVGSTLVGVLPDDSKSSGLFKIQVATSGILSNPVNMPAAAASPGIYSVDGSGYGPGYILNSDGNRNSSSNPAAPGSTITIFATGAGPYTLAGPYTVLAKPPAVFIDGFYANGVSAITAPVPGFPGNVYQITVAVPDPAKLVAQNANLLNFKMPPQVGVKLVIGTVNPLNPDNSSLISQPGLVLNVKQ